MAFCGMQPFGHCPAVERQSRFAFWKNNVYRKRTIFDECEFYSSSCHFASCRGYALTCVAVQGSGSIRGSHVEPKQSPVTLGAPLGWLGIRRSHITDLQHHQEVVSPKESGGPSEPWRRIDSCYQFNSICIYIYVYSGKGSTSDGVSNVGLPNYPTSQRIHQCSRSDDWGNGADAIVLLPHWISLDGVLRYDWLARST